MEFAHDPRGRAFAAMSALATMVLLAVLLLAGLRVHLAGIGRAALHPVTVLSVPPPGPPPRPPHSPRHRPGPTSAPPRNAEAAPAPASPPPAAPPVPIVLLPPQQSAAIATGTGNGSAGPGNGSGGNGSGSGSGSGRAGPAEQVSGHLGPRDLPAGTIPPGGQLSIGVTYTVGIDGRVHDCSVFRSSGSPDIDALVCQLLARRFRYRPARNATGSTVASTIRETHGWARKPEN